MTNTGHRRRTLRRQIQVFLKENLIEVVFVIIVLLGVLLVIIRRKHVDAFLTQIMGILNGLEQFFLRFSLYDLLGAFLAIVALLFLFWRVRVRFLRSNRWLAQKCPTCGGTIVRVHRNLWDRFLGMTILPHSRRYSCQTCKWSGLRHHGQDSHKHKNKP